MTTRALKLAAAAVVAGVGAMPAHGAGERRTFSDQALRAANRLVSERIGAMPAPAFSPENAGASDVVTTVFPVSEVNLRDAGEGQLVATGIITAFGKSGVRPPEMVVDGPDWGLKTIKARMSLAMTDLNFAKSPELPEEGVREAAVLFHRGYRSLYPGPDMFIFDGAGQASDVRISPIYRTNRGEYIEGEPVVIDVPTGAGRVDVGGRQMFGVGIDLDEWAAKGDAPEGALLSGAVIRHAGKGAAFTPMKIVMADGEVIGLRGMSDQAFGLQSFSSSGGGGSLGGGGGFYGGGGGIGGTPTEVPAPGACALLLGAAAVAGRRKRGV